MAELRRRGYDPAAMRCLEVFGGTGDIHLLDYAHRIRELTIWEIDKTAASRLRQRFPAATIQTVDSHKEVERHEGRYELIVIDNPMSTYGPWCEHFGLFPDVFRLAADRAVMMVAVIPDADAGARSAYPYLFNRSQLEERRRFYRAGDPEHVPFDSMVKIYAEHAESAGLSIDWWFSQRRTHMHYLVLGLSRATV
ncbi:MAG: hypothetical protein MUF78_01430 [Candidatus Edwardsbacteria bacterium]|nr:hypothetical protein [Candidatus Edwardsbacteria bacterium]